MTTYKGTTQTFRDTGGETQFAGGIWRAKEFVILDFYTILGTEASGSTIKLFGSLPAGANLIQIELYVSAAQTALTASIGDADSTTRYKSATTDLQTAGSYRYSLQGRVVGTSTYDNQILITTGGATATAGTLFAVLRYTEPAN